MLPNPIGQRDEPGPLWVTEPTLRLLLRLSGPKHGLCEPPEIHESYTSGATENLLEKFRIALKDARDTAIAEGDDGDAGVREGDVLQVRVHDGGVELQPGALPPGLDAHHPLPGLRQPLDEGAQGPRRGTDRRTGDGHRRTPRHRRLAPCLPRRPLALPRSRSRTLYTAGTGTDDRRTGQEQ